MTGAQNQRHQSREGMRAKNGNARLIDTAIIYVYTINDLISKTVFSTATLNLSRVLLDINILVVCTFLRKHRAQEPPPLPPYLTNVFAVSSLTVGAEAHNRHRIFSLF